MSQRAHEYTKFQNDTSWYKHAGEGTAPELAYLSMGLAGESGEFVDNAKKLVRQVGFIDDHMFHYLMNQHVRDDLVDELGDVLWYLNKLADFLGYTIEELMVLNTFKLYNRLGQMAHFNVEPEWPFTEPELSFDNVHAHLTKEEETS